MMLKFIGINFFPRADVAYIIDAPTVSFVDDALNFAAVHGRST